MLAWLDTHAGAVQAIATVVLVGITAWYARLTRKIAQAAAAGAEIQRQAAVAQRLRFLGVVARLELHLTRLPDNPNESKLRNATLWSERDLDELLALAPNVGELAVIDAQTVALDLRWLAECVLYVKDRPIGSGVDPERLHEWAEHLTRARKSLVTIDNRETPADLVARHS